MPFVPNWAPNLHPLIIHFPIALLVGAVLLDGLALLLLKDWWPARASAVLYAVGALSAILAWLTGRIASDSVVVAAEAQSLLSAHADWAFWTMLFFLLLAVGRLALVWRKTDSFALRGGAFAAGLIGVLLLYQTGDRGARMVFGYGVGTGALTTAQASEEAVDLASPTRSQESVLTVVSGLRRGEDGSWYWQAGPGALGDLLGQFKWLQGRPDELDPRLVQYPDSSYALELQVKGGPIFLVSSASFEDVQVDLDAGTGDFEGSLTLVHHVQSLETFDFLRFESNGLVTLGRRVEGTDHVTESAGTADRPTGFALLSAVGSSTHFRGYIDRELIIHGHGETGQAGGAGIRIEGEGTLRIKRLDLRPLSGG